MYKLVFTATLADPSRSLWVVVSKPEQANTCIGAPGVVTCGRLGTIIFPRSTFIKIYRHRNKKIESGIMLLADYLDVTLITLNFQNVAFETQKGFVNTFSALRSFEWYVLKNIVQLEHYDFEHHLCCISIQLRKLT